MSAIRIRRVRAASVLKVLSFGRTKPCLIVGTDEEGNDVEVVVKWRAGMELKATGLVCELMAALLADDLDLHVPKPFLVEVEEGFLAAITTREVSEVPDFARNSVGLNFGSRWLSPGFHTWPSGKHVPLLLRPDAADIFGFDVLIQNPDRRQDNPNLLTNGEQIYVLDHELAFPFLAGAIGWQPPWTGQSTGFLRNHVFFNQLSGGAHDWERLRGALAGLTDARLQEYISAVPNEWRSDNRAAERIVEYLQQARQNRDALFRVISEILK